MSGAVLPAEVMAALNADPQYMFTALRLLAEEPTIRPSVRVAARRVLKVLRRQAEAPAEAEEDDGDG